MINRTHTKNISLSDSIEKLKGVNCKIVKPLKVLGIHTVYDLLRHIPFRYDDFSKIVNIAELTPGETATIRAKINKITNKRTWKKNIYITEAEVSDESGMIKAVWFNQPFLTRNLKIGGLVNLAGKAVFNNNSLYLQNPAYERIFENSTSEHTHTGGLVPIYRETAGITSRWIRFLVKNSIEQVAQIEEILPQEIIKKHDLLPISSAILKIHFPENVDEVKEAKRRLAFEELLLIQLLILKARRKIKKSDAPPIPFDIEKTKRFVASLSFALTDSQRKAAWEILQDMSKNIPMNRLLEGDVGSGKTVVAAIAALNAASKGRQIAIMAPTEVLARQHFHTLSNMVADFGFNVGLLTGNSAEIFDSEIKSEYKLKKQEFLNQLTSKKLLIVTGTHALISEKVSFPSLGLIVLDEQHRFGVNQRAELLKRYKTASGLMPHLLSMTATPIPRTLTLTLYGDLDISLLNEMPKNRKNIITKIITLAERPSAYDFVREEIKKGRQAFVICPRIEAQEDSKIKSEKAYQQELLKKEVKAVKEEYQKLSSEIFPDLKIAMLHGKMKPQEKERIMKEFKANRFNILVSTSVIEVGIDVPNAVLMLIEGAEHFGLAQLHQFRGRVGRGEYQSYCFLFAGNTVLANSQRLKVLINCQNGFELAEKDLEIRGPGDFLGTRQSGLPDLTMASLTNKILIKEAREEAMRLLKEDPELIRHSKLKKHLEKFNSKIHFE